MTNQEAFDKVVRHLLKQNEKSYKQHSGSGDASFECAYRGKGGRMCAIGCLIPDHEYNPLMDSEATGVSSLRTRFAPPSLVGLSWDLLADLQRLHDSRDVNAWRQGLESIGRAFGLTMPDLESPNV